MSGHKFTKGKLGGSCLRCGRPASACLRTDCTSIGQESDRKEKKLQVGKLQAIELAKQIIAYRAFVPTPTIGCATCNGTGRYEEEHPHNGSTFEAACECLENNRPHSPDISIWDDSLLTLAKVYLKKVGK